MLFSCSASKCPFMPFTSFLAASADTPAAGFIMNQSTFDVGIDGMEDKNGQPIGRTNYGINGEESYRFMGKTVETVEEAASADTPAAVFLLHCLDCLFDKNNAVCVCRLAVHHH